MGDVVPAAEVASMLRRAVPEAAATPARRMDEAGYADVFAEHHARLLRLGYLLCGDVHRAEDAVADAFAKVWPHWRRGRVADDAAYLRRALVNEVRSRARRRVLEDRDAERRRATDPRLHHDADVTDRHELLAALAALPARQRAVVVLRFHEDLSTEATAAALGMRVGTVKSQTSRALARLRTILGEER